MTTGRPVYQITTAPPPPRPVRPRWGRLRGLAAVVTLLLTAADTLISAVTGWPPAARTWRRLADGIATAYHHGAAPRPRTAPMISPERETDG
jgi:hypothetical protein